jgi:hypothetical protein
MSCHYGVERFIDPTEGMNGLNDNLGIGRNRDQEDGECFITGSTVELVGRDGRVEDRRSVTNLKCEPCVTRTANTRQLVGDGEPACRRDSVRIPPLRGDRGWPSI